MHIMYSLHGRGATVLSETDLFVMDLGVVHNHSVVTEFVIIIEIYRLLHPLGY